MLLAAAAGRGRVSSSSSASSMRPARSFFAGRRHSSSSSRSGSLPQEDLGAGPQRPALPPAPLARRGPFLQLEQAHGGDVCQARRAAASDPGTDRERERERERERATVMVPEDRTAQHVPPPMRAMTSPSASSSAGIFVLSSAQTDTQTDTRWRRAEQGDGAGQVTTVRCGGTARWTPASGPRRWPCGGPAPRSLGQGRRPCWTRTLRE